MSGKKAAITATEYRLTILINRKKMTVKKTKSVAEICREINANCDRINEIAGLCEKEKRDRTDAESAEYASLVRSNDMNRMLLQAMQRPANIQERSIERESMRILRENLAARRPTTIMLVRDDAGTGTDTGSTDTTMATTDLLDSGIIPVRQQTLLKPLDEGLIFSRVGVPFRTGLSGDYFWPTYEGGEATINGEKDKLTATKIPTSKLKASFDRIGTMIVATRESLTQSAGLLQSIINTELSDRFVRTINKVQFSLSKVTGAKNLEGPFVSTKNTVDIAATPTLKDFTKMKAKVFEKGIPSAGCAFVMTEGTKAVLEATPVDTGSGIMLVQNDHLAGFPVYCTHYIGDNNVGFGSFTYNPWGQFGQMSIVIDPYTEADTNSVRFVANGDFGDVVLRPEAFVLGKIATA